MLFVFIHEKESVTDTQPHICEYERGVEVGRTMERQLWEARRPDHPVVIVFKHLFATITSLGIIALIGFLLWLLMMGRFH